MLKSFYVVYFWRNSIRLGGGASSSSLGDFGPNFEGSTWGLKESEIFYCGLGESGAALSDYLSPGLGDPRYAGILQLTFWGKLPGICVSSGGGGVFGLTKSPYLSSCPALKSAGMPQSTFYG